MLIEVKEDHRWLGNKISFVLRPILICFYGDMAWWHGSDVAVTWQWHGPLKNWNLAILISSLDDFFSSVTDSNFEVQTLYRLTNWLKITWLWNKIKKTGLNYYLHSKWKTLVNQIHKEPCSLCLSLAPAPQLADRTVMNRLRIRTLSMT